MKHNPFGEVSKLVRAEYHFSILPLPLPVYWGTEAQFDTCMFLIFDIHV